MLVKCQGLNSSQQNDYKQDVMINKKIRMTKIEEDKLTIPPVLITFPRPTWVIRYDNKTLKTIYLSSIL